MTDSIGYYLKYLTIYSKKVVLFCKREYGGYSLLPNMVMIMKDDSEEAGQPLSKILHSQFPEVNNKVAKRKRVPQTKYEVTHTERNDILQKVGIEAFLLYQYYLRMSAVGEVPMEDCDALNYFNNAITLRKIADARRALQRLNYFKRTSFTSKSGAKSITYYVSQEAVAGAA